MNKKPLGDRNSPRGKKERPMIPISPSSSVPHLSTAIATLTAAHPGAACRIERGARLVIAGAVTPIYGIGYLVASESEPGRDYWVMRVNDVLHLRLRGRPPAGLPLQARLGHRPLHRLRAARRRAVRPHPAADRLRAHPARSS